MKIRNPGDDEKIALDLKFDKSIQKALEEVKYFSGKIDEKELTLFEDSCKSAKKEHKNYLHRMLALHYQFEVKSYEKSIVHWNELLETEDRLESLLGLADCYARLDKTAEAVNCYNKALGMTTDITLVQNIQKRLKGCSRATTLALAGQQAPQEDIGKNFKDTDVIDVLISNGHLQEALDKCTEALTREPNSKGLHYRMATIYGKMKKASLALEEFKLS